MYGSDLGHRVIAKDVMDVQVHSSVMTLSVSFVTSRRREGEAPVCVRLVGRQMDRFLGGGCDAATSSLRVRLVQGSGDSLRVLFGGRTDGRLWRLWRQSVGEYRR